MLQPLREYAARRSLLERLPFRRGYGVDIGLLLDAYSESASTASPRSTSTSGTIATPTFSRWVGWRPRCCTPSSTGSPLTAGFRAT